MTETSKREKSAAKSKSVRKALKISGVVALCVVLALLLINTCLNVFVDGYYPTFGGYRLFSVVSDSMEGEIPTGSIIASKKPRSEDDIRVGSVITYVLKSGGSETLITHRVTNIYKNETTGDVRYTTKGDNVDRADSVRPFYTDVVGVYTGRKCGFLGYIFGFLQSTEGAIALIIIIFIIAITLIVAHFVSIVTMWRKAALAARVIQLKPQVKEWYSLIKNELLSYDGVRVRSARACETFMRGRGAVARMVVRGKTLCLRLACDPSALDAQRYAVDKVNSGTPCQYRIKSARRAERAVELIAAVMDECGAAKVPDYVPVDYYAPFEGVVSLMQKGLVKRDIKEGVKTFRIDEVSGENPDAPLS